MVSARVGWFVGVLATASCSSAAPPAPAPPVVRDAAPAPPSDAAPTAAALALRAARAELRARPGVVDVKLDGDELVVEVCRAEAFADDGSRGVPVAVAVVEAATDARGEPCGCANAGAYVAVGASYAADCNTCHCGPRGVAMCTLMSCDVAIHDKAYFARGSTTLRPQDEAVLRAVVDVLKGRPDLTLIVVGHAHTKERRPDQLAQRRAEVVRAFLLASGAPAAQVGAAIGRGATEPLGGEAALDRRVAFELAAAPAP